jgi:hypothetical protein
MAKTPPMVLSEDEALKLLAFLVTAARTQLDEASEYGSLSACLRPPTGLPMRWPTGSPPPRGLS